MSKTTRILICDDDPIVHQSLSLYLDHEDFLHDSAYDGKQALEMIKKEHYDLMLLDQMMPGMTGMEVCQARPQGQPAAHYHADRTRRGNRPHFGT